MFRIESRILGFTTETLHFAKLWKCSCHIFSVLFVPSGASDMQGTEDETKEFPVILRLKRTLKHSVFVWRASNSLHFKMRELQTNKHYIMFRCVI